MWYHNIYDCRRNRVYNNAARKSVFFGNNIAVIAKKEIIRMLLKNKPELQRQFKVRRLALFGSYARDEQQTDSDVDILVDVDPSIGLEFVTLAESIEKLLGVHVDLVSSRAITSKMMKFIESELIYV